MGTKMLDFTKPHVLRDEAEYDAAAAALIALLDKNPSPGTEDHDRLEFFTVLIAAYDAEHVQFAQDPVSPADVVDFVLQQQGRTRADLAEIMGGKSRVSEFFSGTRQLSMGQLQALHTHLGIPAELLLPAAGPAPTPTEKVFQSYSFDAPNAPPGGHSRKKGRRTSGHFLVKGSDGAVPKTVTRSEKANTIRGSSKDAIISQRPDRRTTLSKTGRSPARKK